MASYDDGPALPSAPPPRAVISATDGESTSVSGIYGLHATRNALGEVTYYCKRLKVYLYQRAPGCWCVGSKNLGLACKAYCDHQGKWAVYRGKKWEVLDSLSVTFQDEAEVSEIAAAVAVECRYGNIAGGYLRQGEDMEGRPTYWNPDDEKALWYGPSHQWMISDSAGLGASGEYSSYASSAETQALSPEDADWSATPCMLHPVDGPSGGPSSGRGAGDGGFHDVSFPCTQSSVGDDVGAVEWVRASQLVSADEEVKLFDSVEPNDVLQGALGDCWLLCALSAVAEFPRFVEDRLFETKAFSEDGCYRLRFYDASTWSWIRVQVDDFVPCAPSKWWESARPLFSQPHGNELYILLIEKAFAKLSGSYAKLVGGHPVLAWMALTGCEDLEVWARSDGNWCKSVVAMEKVREAPFDFQQLFTSTTGDHLGDGAMFDFLSECDQRNYIMAASINGAAVEMARDDGLVERHAYSLIAVYSFEGIRLVQLRNPWGNSTEWLGAWCDKSAKWAEWPAVALELGHVGPLDDGLFWMDFSDFNECFDSVEVCAKVMDAKRADFSHARRYNAAEGRTATFAARPTVWAPRPSLSLAAPPAVFASAPAVFAAPAIVAGPEIVAAPAEPPPAWAPTRVGLVYSPPSVVIEYHEHGVTLRHTVLVDVAASLEAKDVESDVLSRLGPKHEKYLDFQRKLSKCQFLRLLRMLVDRHLEEEEPFPSPPARIAP